MLEASTHNHLKEFLTKNPSNWKDLFSFGRIVASFIRKKENLLINSEIFLTEEWLPGILIALFLNRENARFVIPAEKIQFLIDKHLHLYEELGFNFSVQNNQIIFSKHKIFLQTVDDLLNDYYQSSFDKQIIRDYLDDAGWDRTSRPPKIPQRIVEKTYQKYREVFEVLTKD